MLGRHRLQGYSHSCELGALSFLQHHIITDQSIYKTTTVVATGKPEPSGPTVPFEPEIPKSYDACAYDPSSADPFVRPPFCLTG
jgi:hypothetical protein